MGWGLGMWDCEKERERTVGSGLARKRWSVRRMRREDLPTAASPVRGRNKEFGSMAQIDGSEWKQRE